MTMPARKGDWIQTFSGRRFWPLDPRSEDVAIEDIAHALSLVCRFGGHCRCFYSVAQHSVLVADKCPRFPLHALLHDAAEAYLGDMTRPLKRSLREAGMRAFDEAEVAVLAAVHLRFGVAHNVDANREIEDADTRMLLTEGRDLMEKECWSGWAAAQTSKPFAGSVVPWPAERAERAFRDAFVDAVRNRS